MVHKIYHKFSKEGLVHFRCGACDKWWSVPDAPPDKKIWFCTWCGYCAKAEEMRADETE